MTTTLLGKWLDHYDPIHRGWTPAGIANGVCATNGFSFPRIRGGYNLRRAIGRTPDASDPIVGAAGADADAIRTFPWIAHAPLTTYSYRLFPVGGGGCENLDDEALAEVAFDAGGTWIGARPNAPGDLRVKPLAGGRFRIEWTYTDADGQADPAEFRIYSNGGEGSIDFATPTATVAWQRGWFHFAYESGAFAHGTRVRWAVRAATVEGVEDGNMHEVSGWAQAQSPAVNPAIIVSRTEA